MNRIRTSAKENQIRPFDIRLVDENTICDASSREIDIFGLTLKMTHEFGKHLLGTPSARASARSWRARFAPSESRASSGGRRRSFSWGGFLDLDEPGFREIEPFRRVRVTDQRCATKPGCGQFVHLTPGKCSRPASGSTLQRARVDIGPWTHAFSSTLCRTPFGISGAMVGGG